MTVRFYSSTAAETTLSGTINSSATSITIGSAVGLPASTPFTLALDYESASEELVEVTLLAGTTATVTRAIDGTSATSHTAGARVRHVSSARDFSDSRTHENSDDGVHGLAPGDVIVGEDAVQSLTNKTFTSSTWNGGTITGTIAGTPAFSGAVSLNAGGVLAGTFSGAKTFSGTTAFSAAATFSSSATHTGLIQSNRTNATDVVLGALYGAFVNDTFRILANGRIEIGPGTGARDTFLYRALASTLKTDGNFQIVGAVSAATSTVTTANATTVNAGTVTNSTSGIDYHPSQSGTVTASFTSDSFQSIPVVFATPFPTAPKVVISKSNAPGGSFPIVVSAISATTTGFTAWFQTISTTPVTTTNLNADWIAVQV